MTSEDERFNDWLDSLMTNQSVDAPESGSGELDRATSAASEIHASSLDSVSLAKRGDWEGLMMNFHESQVSALPTISRRPASNISALVNIAAVLVIVAGLVATVWTFRGGPEDDRVNDLAQSATPEPTKDSYTIYTDNGDFNPQPADCTIQALENDLVMEKLTATDADFVEIFPPGDDGLPDDAMRDEVKTAFDLYVACSYFGTLSQVAALETNHFFRQKRIARTVPFVSPSTVVGDLEAELANPNPLLESGFSNWSIPEDAFNLLVYPPDMGQVAVTDPYRVQVYVGWDQLSTRGVGKPDERALVESLNEQLPRYWVFVQDAESGRWLLDSMEYD